MNSRRDKNRYNKEKLLHSKWTAVVVCNKQKHFIVTQLIRDEHSQEVVGCVLQAVIDKCTFELDWQELQETERWLQGWK